MVGQGPIPQTDGESDDYGTDENTGNRGRTPDYHKSSEHRGNRSAMDEIADDRRNGAGSKLTDIEDDRRGNRMSGA